MSPRQAIAYPRLLGVLVGFGCLLILIVAALLNPDPTGHGTHTQLGMPACSWVLLWNFPCPTCGMTTAFACAADGRLLAACGVQPMGTLAAILAGIGFWAGFHVALTGHRVFALAGAWARKPVIVGLGVLFVGAWVYKMITWNG